MTVFNDRLVNVLDRLTEKAVEDYYNPFTHFQWPNELPHDAYWMTPSVMSTYGTELESELSQSQLQELSKWESINFYSMNVHGIRELLIEVVNRVHMPGFEIPSEFFHHFIGEENEHMWFFAQFCLRYGNKIYPTINMKNEEDQDPEVSNFLVFSRILLFEEIVDHYNTTMADDPNLHETIREVNRIHHKDESRHIAFGRELVSVLYDQIKDKISEEKRQELETYLKRYIISILRSFCNPQVYRDAGLSNVSRIRDRVLADPQRHEAERVAIRKPMGFLTKSGIVRDPDLQTA